MPVYAEFVAYILASAVLLVAWPPWPPIASRT